MTAADWVQLLAAGATVILLLLAALSDLARYRIPNTIVYAIAAAFAIGAAFNPAWPELGWSALAAIVMFFVGAGLFALRLFGGGDVKLIAAMALWTGFADLPRFLVVMTAIGGVLGVVWVIRRRLRPMTASVPAADATATAAPAAPNKLPYGVAIALAGLDFFFTSAHSPFAALLPWLS